MDNEKYQDEFEQFLQDEVKQHRMYPSDHVWRNVRTELHGYRSWPALTFIALFIITALTISTLIGNHPLREQAMPPVVAVTPAVLRQEATATPMAASKQATVDNSYFGKMAPGSLTASAFVSETEDLGAGFSAAAPVLANTVAEQSPNQVVVVPRTVETLLPPQIVMYAAAEPAEISGDDAGSSKPLMEETVATESKKEPLKPTDKILNDYRVVKIKEAQRNSRFGFQFYVTPSNSYRKLSDEKVQEIIEPANTAPLQSNIPLNMSAARINNVVRHRPAMGLELGFAALYNMTGRLKFKTGLQLNVRQYVIETFKSRTSDLTTLALINNRGIETVNFYSSYNNNTGFKKEELQNRVYQLSVPLGIQWDAIQGRRWGLNTEASVQPTLTLNTNTYILSTDYKHYADASQFIRKWNVNTSVGFNLTYRSRHSSWQIGPQIRYQHLSTYSNAYPIKEHLMDYGIRLGFTRQIIR